MGKLSRYTDKDVAQTSLKGPQATVPQFDSRFERYEYFGTVHPLTKQQIKNRLSAWDGEVIPIYAEELLSSWDRSAVNRKWGPCSDAEISFHELKEINVDSEMTNSVKSYCSKREASRKGRVTTEEVNESRQAALTAIINLIRKVHEEKSGAFLIDANSSGSWILDTDKEQEEAGWEMIGSINVPAVSREV